jgi:tetratricopeptide (TPR) repeat protein
MVDSRARRRGLGGGRLPSPALALAPTRATLTAVALLLAACAGSGAGRDALLDADLADFYAPADVLPAGPGDEVLGTAGAPDALRRHLDGADERVAALYGAELDLLDGRYGDGLDALAQLVVAEPNDVVALIALHRLENTRLVVPRAGRRYAEIHAALTGRSLAPASAELLNELAAYGVEDALEHAGVEDTGPFDAQALGVPSVWRRLGPLSPYSRLDLERREAFETARVLPAAATTVHQREPRLRDQTGEAGVYAYETWVHLDQASERLLVLDSGFGFSAEWNDELVALRPVTGRYRSAQVSRRVHLEPGWHRLRVRLGTPHHATELGVCLVPLRAGEAGVTFAEAPPEGVAWADADFDPPQETTALATLRAQTGGGSPRALDAYAALLLAERQRDEALGERALTELGVALDAPGPAVSPLIAMAAADLVRAAYSRPPNQRENLRLQWLRAAWAGSEGAAGVALELATAVDDEGEAGELLRAVEETHGHEPEIAFSLYRYFAGRDFEALGESWLQRALDAEPTWCLAVEAQVSLLQGREHTPDPDTLGPGFAECEAGVRYRLETQMLPAGQLEESLALLRVLAQRFPDRAYYPRRIGDLLWRLGRGEESIEVVRWLEENAGDSALATRLRADYEWRRGNREEALAAVDAAATDESAGDLGLAELSALLRAEPAWIDLRRDGRAEVARYQAAPNRPVAPVVYAFDYAAHRYFPNGNGVSVTHQILHVQSREALGDVGEVEIPSRALLLRARTIKADGRTLEPTHIPGKDSVSVPDLEVGDFVEYEYVEALRPERGRGDDPSREDDISIVGSRFYFQVRDAPLVHSELVVEVPAEWGPLTLDLRGGAPGPEVSRSEYGDRYRFLVTDSAPPVEENSAPPGTEWLPSVRVAHGRTWDDVADQFRDRAADTVRVTPELRELGLSLVAGAGSEADAAERVFRYVVDEVEELGGFFATDAVWTQRAGEGERMPLLLALFEVAGLRADVLFARAWSDDRTASPIPDAEDYPVTLVRVRADGRWVWLDPGMDHAAFDYVSTGLQGTEAMLVVPAEPTQAVGPVLVPTWPEETHRQITRITATLGDDGSITGEVRERVPLESAAGVRTLLERIPDQRVLTQALEAALGPSVPGVAVTSFETVDDGDPDEPLELVYTFEAAGFARVDAGGDLTIDAHLFDRQLRGSLAAEPTRVHPLVIGAPFDERLEVSLTLPAGMRFEAVPDELSVSDPWVRYERTVATAPAEGGGERLSLTRTTRVPVARVAPAEYPRLVDSLRAIEQAEALHITAVR